MEGLNMISDKTLELNNDMTVRAFVYRPNLSGKNFKNTKFYHFSINKENLALSRFSSPSFVSCSFIVYCKYRCYRSDFLSYLYRQRNGDL